MNIKYIIILINFFVCLRYDCISQTNINHKDGKEVCYFANGKIKSVLNYKNNKLDSISIWYYENGKIETSSNFINGLKNGVSYYYYEDGNIKSIFYTINDTTHLHLQFGKKGKLIREISKGKRQLFYVDGIPYSMEEYSKKSTKK